MPLTGETRVSFPLPPRAPASDRCPAEQCAEADLREGTGTLWTAVHDVVKLLPLSPDGRGFADGLSTTLGAYRKGGILGLSRHTKSMQAVCVLLNAAESRQNALTPSPLIGLSHYVTTQRVLSGLHMMVAVNFVRSMALCTPAVCIAPQQRAFCSMGRASTMPRVTGTRAVEWCWLHIPS